MAGEVTFQVPFLTGAHSFYWSWPWPWPPRVSWAHKRPDPLSSAVPLQLLFAVELFSKRFSPNLKEHIVSKLSLIPKGQQYLEAAHVC